MRKKEVINNINKENKRRKNSSREEETRRSAEVGRRHAASVLKGRARDYQSLLSHQIDKGDRVLNPMIDKLSGLKKHRKSLRGSAGENQVRVSTNKKE